MASLGGKSGSAPSGRHKRIREAEKARWNEGGRKEGRKGLLENRRRQRVGSVAATTVSRCLMLLAFWPSSKDEN